MVGGGLGLGFGGGGGVTDYELSVTFRTSRPLTSGEVADFLNRVFLEVDEPTASDGDGMPCEAEWSGRKIRMLLIDSEGRQAGSWSW
jgi:hypothetical protein